MRQSHGKDVSLNFPFIQGDLGVVFKEPDPHTVIGTALAFQMVFFGFLSFYFKTGISDAPIFIPVLLVQEVFIW